MEVSRSTVESWEESAESTESEAVEEVDSKFCDGCWGMQLMCDREGGQGEVVDFEFAEGSGFYDAGCSYCEAGLGWVCCGFVRRLQRCYLSYPAKYEVGNWLKHYTHHCNYDTRRLGTGNL